jgi:hypothetical protein
MFFADTMSAKRRVSTQRTKRSQTFSGRIVAKHTRTSKMNRGAPLVGAILRVPMSIAAAVNLRTGEAREVEKRKPLVAFRHRFPLNFDTNA